jgi:hypothetical protein
MSVLLALRVIHVVLGVFWAGTILFFATLLEPSVRAAGPEGGRVMQALQQRHYMTIMPAVAVLTILSGIALLWRHFGGSPSGWFATRAGTCFSLGGLASLVAFVLGVFVLRPAALRVGALGRELAQSPGGPEGDAKAALLQALRRRMTLSMRWIAALLLIAVVTMAVARYL